MGNCEDCNNKGWVRAYSYDSVNNPDGYYVQHCGSCSPDCTCQYGHELCAYQWGGWCSRDIEAQNEAAQLQYSIDEYVDFNGLDYNDLGA